MYRSIVARKARRLFAQLNEGDYEALLAGVAPDVHHVFPGDNALGGERHSSEAMRRWFERLEAIFPTHELEVTDVAVKGWPWNTLVLVRWINRGRPQDGLPYENEGVHAIRLRWGKGVDVHAYLDTEKVTEVCDRLARAGFEEAAAPPIID